MRDLISFDAEQVGRYRPVKGLKGVRAMKAIYDLRWKVAQITGFDAADAVLKLVFDHLMEPSEGMVEAGWTGRPGSADGWRQGWQAMLTKAKEEAGL